MKRTRHILVALIAVLTMAFSALAFTACGSNVNGTYTLELSKEQCAGNLYLTGFMSSAGAVQTNTLVLEDGNYELTKHLVSTSTENGDLGVDVTITFTGTYTVSGDEVTLSKAVDAEYDAKYGLFSTLGHLKDDSGKASNGDKVECFSEWSHDPLTFFGGEYYNNTENVEVKVTVNKSDNSFAYVKVESSDDD